MSTYEWYLYGHLTGVFLLLAATGATTGSGIALGRATSANVAVMLLDVMRMSEYIVRSAGAVLVLVFGVLLIDEAGYDFGDAWISTALTLLIVLMAVDHGFLMRRLRKSRAAAVALGNAPVSPELKAMLTDPVTAIVGVALDLTFWVILWLMIAKPGA